MELTFARCEQILDTLPIGYYTGRRIKISLDGKEETSFYSPMEDTIVISYPIIAHRIKQMPEGGDEEEAVRSMLYHEVSHAILTPTSLNPSNPVNIMEDERIESVLRNFYHNVDFRKQLLELHGGHAPKAVDADSAFFNAVRFGLGSGAIQSEINDILTRYANLNRTTERYAHPIDTSNYEWEIRRLYDKIAKEFSKNPDAFNPPPMGNGKQGEMKKMDSLKNSPNGKGEQGAESKANGNNGEEENETERPMPSKIGDPKHGIEKDIKEIKRMVGACLGTKPELDEEEVTKLAEFQKTIETIIGNFNKKNCGGSGINTYSGVFNPRAVSRNDYRFFERSTSSHGNNRFGSCHLNLIIDCSGSFSPNVSLTNGILSVLSEIERKNRNFSLDVVFINQELQICKSVRDRLMRAWGGNEIPENMKEIMISLQKPQTCNYNIVLFDGDAMCNNRDCHGIKEYEKRFGVFDMKQTTLITDPDNEKYMGRGFTSTKVIVTTNYTEELVRHITHALTIAFG